MEYQVFESKGRYIYAGITFRSLQDAEDNAQALSIGSNSIFFIKPVGEICPNQYKGGETTS